MEGTDAPRRGDRQFLEDRINEHNVHCTGRGDFRPLALVVRDDDGSIIAGLDRAAQHPQSYRADCPRPSLFCGGA